MKKTLIALAALAATSAFAQSSVTITGNVGIGYQSVDSRGGTNTQTLSSGLGLAGTGSALVTPSTVGTQVTSPAVLQSGTNRGLAVTDVTLAFTAVEDLGGGMRANANITLDTSGSQFNTAGNFNRRNTSVGLSGNFGSVTLANTRASDLMTRAMVAPASLSDGIYDSSGILARPPIDVLSYTTPNFSGFTGSLSYVELGAVAAPTIQNFFGQGDGNTNFNNTVTVLGLNYANGPIAAGLAFKSHAFSNMTAAAVAAMARSTNTEGFITYDFGMAKVGLGFDSANVAATSPSAAVNAVNDATAWAFGVSVPLGAATIGVNWAQRDVNNMYEAVVNYDLSKRTAVNFSFGRQSFDAVDAVTAPAGQFGAETNGNQYRIRLMHSF